MLCGLQVQFIMCHSASGVLALVLKWTLPPRLPLFVLTAENSLANYTPVHFQSKCTGRFIRALETALLVPLAASARTFARQFNFLSSFNPAPSSPIVSSWMRKDGLLIILAKGWEMQRFFRDAWAVCHQSAFPELAEPQGHKHSALWHGKISSLIVKTWQVWTQGARRFFCLLWGLRGVTQNGIWPQCFMQEPA